MNLLEFPSVYIGEDTQILSAYYYSPELIIRKEKVLAFESVVELDVVYNKQGKYVGSLDTLERLSFIKGLIDIQPIDDNSKICSIGFNENEQKWYAWTHRGYCGFSIGSEVKQGHVAYVPENLESLIESRINFYDLTGKLFHIGENNSTLSNTSYKKVHTSTEIFEDIFKLNYVFTRINSDNEIFQLENSHVMCEIPKSFGRGEWVAKTLEDAKQMSIDYARGLS